MSDRATHAPVSILDPVERFTEIVFGLIMVLTFTCSLAVAEADRADVREMIIGALGCNLAWGIIDAAFYLFAVLAERGRNAHLLRQVQGSSDPAAGRRIVADTMPLAVQDALPLEALEQVRASIAALPKPPSRVRFVKADGLGALGVFLLVFLSTFPVVLPFFFLQELQVALRLSNAVAIVLLFGASYKLAQYSGLRPFRTGAAMVGIGVALVAIAIALGG